MFCFPWGVSGAPPEALSIAGPTSGQFRAVDKPYKIFKYGNFVFVS